MKIKSALLSLFTAALFLLPTGLCADTSEEYIISIKDGTTISESFIEEYDLVPITEEDHGVYVTNEENARRLENSTKVETVEESSYVRLLASYNDPYFSSNQQWIFEAINGSMLNSYSINYTPTVVVIDTGFDFNHEDALNSSINPGSDIIAGINPATGRYYKTTKDYFTHGTACTGVIGAATNNGKGIAGIFTRCNIYVSCIFKADENGDPKGSTADVCAAIYDAVDQYNADVISMSFGDTNYTKALDDAIQYAYQNGVLLVAAAGNSGSKGNAPEYPACFDGVISVANAKNKNEIAASSTYNQYVDVAAPGTSIYTLLANTNSYAPFSGTSLATPYVAGLAAYAKAVRPDITPTTFEYYLRATARDIVYSGYDNYSGYGMINCAAFSEALSNLPSGNGTQDSPYLIGNVDDLNHFISVLQSGDSDACARITANLTVPSDFKGYSGTYTGILNGDNHRISGLTTTFIDILGSGGTIKNFYVKGTVTDDAILVRENRGTIYGCVTEGSLTNSSTAGGICAANYGSILYALNRAAITGSVAAGIAPYSYGTIEQCINRGTIKSEAKTAAGICTYLHNGASVRNCYNASSLSGISSLGGVIHTMGNGAFVENCYYGDNREGTVITNKNICPKSFEFMKTRGFICMLNNNGVYFKEDSNNVNNGYPVWGSSDINTYFYDVPVYEWYADDVYTMAADKILQGRSEGYFYPEDNITRAEFITILAKINGVDTTISQGYEPFYDVNTSNWYYNAVCWAYNTGLAMGNGDGSFKPEANITREEISAFIVRYLRAYSSQSLPNATPLTFADSYKVSSWARTDVSILYNLGIISGFPDGTFRPQNEATRAQAAKMTNAMRNEL